MRLKFSERPGRHERHAIRLSNSEFISDSEYTLTETGLTELQRLDHEELIEFIGELRELVLEAARLGPHEDSERVLDLKERLDMAYEKSARLADDQNANQNAIIKLTGVIMATVRQSAGDDTVALHQLSQEAAARQAHFELLAHPLIADLLDPESLIEPNQLLPCLMSAPDNEFEAALNLFQPGQLDALLLQGQALQQRNVSADAQARLEHRLALMQQASTQIADQ